MEVQTDSERVRHSRRLVLELLGSSVDVDLAGPRRPDGTLAAYAERYGADPARFGPPAAPAAAGERDAREAGHHHAPTASRPRRPSPSRSRSTTSSTSATTRSCILCYKCVEACGVDAQNTFAIAVAGRGFDARISTEWNVGLPDSACVYCGNCIGVCPTGALMFRSEHEMREAGTWDESAQTVTDTICPYCGVGCTLSLHVQDNAIVKVTSPMDSSVTDGHLCIKGRFGFQFVQNRAADRLPRRGSSADAPSRARCRPDVRWLLVPRRAGRDGADVLGIIAILGSAADLGILIPLVSSSRSSSATRSSGSTIARRGPRGGPEPQPGATPASAAADPGQRPPPDADERSAPSDRRAAPRRPDRASGEPGGQAAADPRRSGTAADLARAVRRSAIQLGIAGIADPPASASIGSASSRCLSSHRAVYRARTASMSDHTSAPQARWCRRRRALAADVERRGDGRPET